MNSLVFSGISPYVNGIKCKNWFRAYKIKNTPNIILKNFEVLVEVVIIGNLIIKINQITNRLNILDIFYLKYDYCHTITF